MLVPCYCSKSQRLLARATSCCWPVLRSHRYEPGGSAGSTRTHRTQCLPRASPATRSGLLSHEEKPWAFGAGSADRTPTLPAPCPGQGALSGPSHRRADLPQLGRSPTGGRSRFPGAARGVRSAPLSLGGARGRAGGAGE